MENKTSTTLPQANWAVHPGTCLMCMPTAYLLSVTGVTRSLTRKGMSPPAGWYRTSFLFGKNVVLRTTFFPKSSQLNHLFRKKVAQRATFLRKRKRCTTLPQANWAVHPDTYLMCMPTAYLLSVIEAVPAALKDAPTPDAVRRVYAPPDNGE